MKTRTVIRVRNTRHEQYFLSDLHSFWNKSCYADAVLVGKAQNGLSPFKSVLVNKSILAAVSHKFEQLLINTEDDVNIIFPDTDFAIINFFASFIYSGEIVLSADDYHIIGADLKSFFSEWDVHFPETVAEKNFEANSSCRNKPQKRDKIMKQKCDHSASNKELPVFKAKYSSNPKPSVDRSANFKKPLQRTYKRKSKKPEKLVETDPITPDSSVFNHAISIDSKDDTQLTTIDRNNITINRPNVAGELQETIPSHSEELYQEPDQTNMLDDTNLSEILPEDEEDRKLDTLSEEVDKYTTHATHLGSDQDLPQTTSTKPKRLPCAVCGKEISADYMTDHLKLHTNERSYLCELCGASFVLSDRLRKHMKLVHNHSKPQLQTYTCKTCGKTFNKANSLKMHETLHLGLKPYKCPYCDKSFRLSAVLHKHKRIHTGEKPYECSVCLKRFSARSNYVTHFRSHDKSSGSVNFDEINSCYDVQSSLYRCTTCGATFRRQNPFLTHMAAHRGEEPKLPCKHCSETFPTFKLLKNHRIEKHADALFKCDECSALFATSQALRNHAIIHKEGKTPRCSICCRCFRTFDELTAHKQNFHANEIRVACKVCGKDFNSLMTLRTHSRLHSDERPYQCAYCPKAFRQDTHLANHVRIHTGERPFLCAVCGKSFRLKNNLQVHMKTHTGEKIQCETCGKIFRSFVKLKEHEDTHCVGEEQPSHVSALYDSSQDQE